ncbi:non-ribosomal peptide synthetase [Virgisporangium ochraceum]|uniref:non-ribosomal peptide synthetase n=1 Tax=Virgisporangium ochraceum TaxID=65505 RepID=UPI0019414BCE|nr:non-ribosomal peptide synthetase [Virgisporangium ochraceum]
MTPKEHTLWTLQHLAPDVAVSNLPVAVRVPGRLRWWPLRAAVNHLVMRHPALRTAFPAVGHVPTKVVLDEQACDVEVDVFDTSEAALADELRRYAARPFDPAAAPLLRAGHFLCPDGDVVCLVVHHLVFDATSEGILVRELAALYTGFADSEEPPAELGATAGRYVERPVTQESLAYWNRELQGVDRSAMQLGIGRPEPADPTFTGSRLTHVLSDASHRGLTQLARDLRATDNIVALAAFCLLLRLHGAGSDLVVGVPIDIRDSTGSDSIGYHVNTLALRIDMSTATTFRDLVAHTRDRMLTALSHADAPFDVLMPELDRAGFGWRTPLFRHMFNFRPAVTRRVEIGGMPATLIAVDKGLSRLDLEFAVFHEKGGTGITVVYSTELHHADDVQALVDRYDALLRAVALDPGQPLDDSVRWSERDRRTVTTANDTRRHTRWSTVGSAFAAQCARRSDAVAIRSGSTDVTYRELATAARFLAGRLTDAGVLADDVVAVSLPRGPELAATALAVWSVGAAYLPLDPGHPPSRLAFQISDSGASLLVTDREPPEDVAAVCTTVIRASGPSGRVPAETADVVPAPAAPVKRESLAYIIYTSGSTGTPKGVEITHGNLANVVSHFADELDARAGESCLWMTTFAFDISALELFLPLTVGARVVVAPDDARSDPAVLSALVRDEDVGILQGTPTTWRMLAGEAGGCLKGRRVLCGGEPLPPVLSAALVGTGCTLWNVYGPTETTIWSTSSRIEAADGDVVHVGRPIANTRILVLDGTGREQPPGLPGEVCIAGDGVAAGYRRRPELTTERFHTDPVHGRYYRTGDLGRWRHDGAVELTGRDDRQVKLRAHRIELDEVEAVLEQHAGVRSAAVVLVGDPTSDGHLVAFLRSSPRPGLVEDVWEHAARLLPRYSVPSRFVVLGQFPLTANGKIDHRELTRMAQRRTWPDEAGGASPATPDDLTHQLLELWCQLLGRADLGPEANFFVNGGHSLSAAQLVTRISRLTGRPTSLSTLFEAPTPVALARVLAASPVAGTVRS